MDFKEQQTIIDTCCKTLRDKFSDKEMTSDNIVILDAMLKQMFNKLKSDDKITLGIIYCVKCVYNSFFETDNKINDPLDFDNLVSNIMYKTPEHELEKLNTD